MSENVKVITYKIGDYQIKIEVKGKERPRSQKYFALGMCINPSNKEHLRVLEILQRFSIEKGTKDVSNTLKKLILEYDELRSKLSILEKENQQLKEQVRKYSERLKYLENELERVKSPEKYICDTVNVYNYTVEICGSFTAITVFKVFVKNIALTKKELKSILEEMKEMGIISSYEVR